MELDRELVHVLQGKLEVADGLLRLAEAGRGDRRRRAPSRTGRGAGSAAAPASSLAIASSTHATRRSNGTSAATRACIIPWIDWKSARRAGCSDASLPKYSTPSHSRWPAMNSCAAMNTTRLSEFGSAASARNASSSRFCVSDGRGVGGLPHPSATRTKTPEEATRARAHRPVDPTNWSRLRSARSCRHPFCPGKRLRSHARSTPRAYARICPAARRAHRRQSRRKLARLHLDAYASIWRASSSAGAREPEERGGATVPRAERGEFRGARRLDDPATRAVYNEHGRFLPDGAPCHQRVPGHARAPGVAPPDPYLRRGPPAARHPGVAALGPRRGGDVRRERRQDGAPSPASS